MNVGELQQPSPNLGTDVNFNSPGHRSSQDGSFIQDDENAQLILDFAGTRNGKLATGGRGSVAGRAVSDGSGLAPDETGGTPSSGGTEWARDFDANVAELDFDNVLATHDILEMQEREDARRAYQRGGGNGGQVGGPLANGSYPRHLMRNSLELSFSEADQSCNSLFSSVDVGDSMGGPTGSGNRLSIISSSGEDAEFQVPPGDGLDGTEPPTAFLSTDSLNLSGIKEACTTRKRDYMLTFSRMGVSLNPETSVAITGGMGVSGVYPPEPGYADADLSHCSDRIRDPTTDGPPILETDEEGLDDVREIQENEILETDTEIDHEEVAVRIVERNQVPKSHSADGVNVYGKKRASEGAQYTSWGQIKRSMDENQSSSRGSTPQKRSLQLSGDGGFSSGGLYNRNYLAETDLPSTTNTIGTVNTDEVPEGAGERMLSGPEPSEYDEWRGPQEGGQYGSVQDMSVSGSLTMPNGAEMSEKQLNLFRMFRQKVASGGDVGGSMTSEPEPHPEQQRTPMAHQINSDLVTESDSSGYVTGEVPAQNSGAEMAGNQNAFLAGTTSNNNSATQYSDTPEVSAVHHTCLGGTRTQGSTAAADRRGLEKTATSAGFLAQPDWEYAEYFVNGRYIDMNHNEVGFVPPSTRPVQRALTSSPIRGRMAPLRGPVAMSPIVAHQTTILNNHQMDGFPSPRAHSASRAMMPGSPGGAAPPSKPPRTYASTPGDDSPSDGVGNDRNEKEGSPKRRSKSAVDMGRLKESATQLPVYVVNQSVQTTSWDRGQLQATVTTSFEPTARNTLVYSSPNRRTLSCFAKAVDEHGAFSLLGRSDATAAYLSATAHTPHRSATFSGLTDDPAGMSVPAALQKTPRMHSLPDLDFAKLPFKTPVPNLFPHVPPFPPEFGVTDPYQAVRGGLGNASSAGSYQATFAGLSSGGGISQSSSAISAANSTPLSSFATALSAPSLGATSKQWLASTTGLPLQVFERPADSALLPMPPAAHFQSSVSTPDVASADVDTMSRLKHYLYKAGDGERDSGLGSSTDPGSGGSSTGTGPGPKHVKDWESLSVLLPKDVLHAYSFFKTNSNLMKGADKDVFAYHAAVDYAGMFSASGGDNLSIDKGPISPLPRYFGQQTSPRSGSDGILSGLAREHQQSGGGVNLRGNAGLRRRQRPLSEPMSLFRVRRLSEIEPIPEANEESSPRHQADKGKRRHDTLPIQQQQTPCCPPIRQTCSYMQGCCHGHHCCCCMSMHRSTQSTHGGGLYQRSGRRSSGGRSFRYTAAARRAEKMAMSNGGGRAAGCRCGGSKMAESLTESDATDCEDHVAPCCGRPTAMSIPRTTSYHPMNFGGGGGPSQGLPPRSRRRVSGPIHQGGRLCGPVAPNGLRSDCERLMGDGCSSSSTTGDTSSSGEDADRSCSPRTIYSEYCLREKNFAVPDGSVPSFYSLPSMSHILPKPDKPCATCFRVRSSSTDGETVTAPLTPERKTPTGAAENGKSMICDCQTPDDRTAQKIGDPVLEVTKSSDAEKKVMVRSVINCSDRLLSLFSSSERLERGDLPEASLVSGLVKNSLCPTLRRLLSDGARVHVWRVITSAATMGPATIAIHQMVTHLVTVEQNGEHSLDALLDSFLIGLLRLKSMDCWLSYMVLKEKVLRQHYEEDSFLRSAVTRHRGLFSELISGIQPLSLLPMDKLVPGLMGLSGIQSRNCATARDVPASVQSNTTAGGVRTKSDAGLVRSNRDKLGLELSPRSEEAGDFEPKRYALIPSTPAADSRVPKSSSIPSKLSSNAATTPSSGDVKSVAGTPKKEVPPAQAATPQHHSTPLAVPVPGASPSRLPRPKAKSQGDMSYAIAAASAAIARAHLQKGARASKGGAPLVASPSRAPRAPRSPAKLSMPPARTSSSASSSSRSVSRIPQPASVSKRRAGPPGSKQPYRAAKSAGEAATMLRNSESEKDKLVTAIDSYKDIKSGMSVRKGETLTVLSEEKGWVTCRRGAQVGRLPRNKVTFVTFL